VWRRLDFGFSNVYDPAGMMETFCGSPPYAAPELFQGVRYTGPEVDIWSLGIILYVMSTSCLPFDGRNFQEMKAVVCRGRFIIPDHVSDGTMQSGEERGVKVGGGSVRKDATDPQVRCQLAGLRALIRSMVVVDRSQRASLKAFLDDPWLNEDGPAVERLLQLGLDRETIIDQGSLLPEDAGHLPVDYALVQAMSAKFGIPNMGTTPSWRRGSDGSGWWSRPHPRRHMHGRDCGAHSYEPV
jgi:serine/threonine protein kinase